MKTSDETLQSFSAQVLESDIHKFEGPARFLGDNEYREGLKIA
jgi:hypothetical protein